MKLITSTSAALLVATLALGAAAPAAFAQDQGLKAGPAGGPRHQQMLRFHGGEGGGMRGGLLQLVCSEEGADRLELMLLAVSQRLDLTAEQAPLFDDLKAAALTAQTSFSDTCASARPAAGETAEMPNLVERLETRIKVDEARIAALSDVLPSLQAFYDSLTDEQKAQLDAPFEGRREHFGKRQGGPDRPGRPRSTTEQNG